MSHQKSTLFASILFIIGLGCFAWYQHSSLQWQNTIPYTPTDSISDSVIQQLSKLPDLIAKEEFAQTPINIEDFGGWPKQHTVIGSLSIPDANISCDIIYGDNNNDLNRGACFYADRKDRIPGGGLQMLMASHNNTYFHTLGEVQPGSKIIMDLYYGQYEYEVVRTEVVKASDTTTYDLSSTQEELIVYTCYPFDQLTATPYRFFVYCKPVYARPLQK